MARPPNPEAQAAMEAAARHAFAEVGVDAARIEDIARAAGMSKASFYVYFESKDALFASLVGRFFEAAQGCADERHRALGELVERLGPCDARDWATRSPRFEAYAALDHHYTLRILRVLWDWRDILHCVLEQTTGPRRALVDQVTRLTLETLAGRLEEAMRLGFLRPDVDPALASEILVGAYLQLGRRMFGLPEPPDFERWARTVEIVLNEGLRPREGVEP